MVTASRSITSTVTLQRMQGIPSSSPYDFVFEASTVLYFAFPWQLSFWLAQRRTYGERPADWETDGEASSVGPAETASKDPVGSPSSHDETPEDVGESSEDPPSQGS